MQAKEYLLQLKKLDTLINNKQQILDSMRVKAVCRSPQYDMDTKPTQPNPKSQENLMLSIIELEQELEADIDRFVKMKKTIIKTIDELEDSNELDLIYKRYVLFESWEQISVEMNYTFRNVLIIHGKALKNLNAILNIS